VSSSPISARWPWDRRHTTREVTPGPPIRVDYRLTEKGRALDEAITALSNWADSWVEQPAPPQSASGTQRTKTTTSTG
jgi:DNA-binding HxlR family transcriptional regulator